MWTSIILFILGVAKDILKDVIKEHISRPDIQIKENYTGKVNAENLALAYNPYEHFSKYERLFDKDGAS